MKLDHANAPVRASWLRRISHGAGHDRPAHPNVLLAIFGIPDTQNFWIRILARCCWPSATSTFRVGARPRPGSACLRSLPGWGSGSPVWPGSAGRGAARHRAVRRRRRGGRPSGPPTRSGGHGREATLPGDRSSTAGRACIAHRDAPAGRQAGCSSPQAKVRGPVPHGSVADPRISHGNQDVGQEVGHDHRDPHDRLTGPRRYSRVA